MSSLPFVLHYLSTLLSLIWLSWKYILKRWSSLKNFISTQCYNYILYSWHTKSNEQCQKVLFKILTKIICKLLIYRIQNEHNLWSMISEPPTFHPFFP
jgi:hypothetical protein